MTATVSPVRLMSPSALRFGVWRSRPAKHVAEVSAHDASHDGPASGWRVEWQLDRPVPMPPEMLQRAWWLAMAVAVTAAWASVNASGGLHSSVQGLAWLALGAVLSRMAVQVYASHAQDHDHIAMSPYRVRVASRRGGRTQSFELHPRWVRVEPVQHDRSLIRLSGQGQQATVGEFVPTASRKQLADELRWALRHLDE